MRRFDDWAKESLCHSFGIDSSLFFPEKQTSTYIDEYLPCKDCPVKRDCRNRAIIYDEEGIWGGLSKKDRNRIAKQKSKYSLYFGDTIRDRLTDQAIRQGLLDHHVYNPEVQQYIASRRHLVKIREQEVQALLHTSLSA